MCCFCTLSPCQGQFITYGKSVSWKNQLHYQRCFRHDSFESNSVYLNASPKSMNQYHSGPHAVSWPRFISLWFSGSVFESAGSWANFGAHTFIRLWINIYLGYYFLMNLICLCFFFLTSLNLLNAKFICNCTCSNPDPCSVCQQMIWVMTEFNSFLIQRISIWISESFGHDHDLLLKHSAGHWLNQQIIWLWWRFIPLLCMVWVDFGMNQWTNYLFNY